VAGCPAGVQAREKKEREEVRREEKKDPGSWGGKKDPGPRGRKQNDILFLLSVYT
jgi:hypothetical protein